MSIQKAVRSRILFPGELIPPMGGSAEFARKPYMGCSDPYMECGRKRDSSARRLVRCADGAATSCAPKHQLPPCMTFVNFSKKGRNVC